MFLSACSGLREPTRAPRSSAISILGSNLLQLLVRASSREATRRRRNETERVRPFSSFCLCKCSLLLPYFPSLLSRPLITSSSSFAPAFLQEPSSPLPLPHHQPHRLSNVSSHSSPSRPRARRQGRARDRVRPEGDWTDRGRWRGGSWGSLESSVRV